ncbi:MAG TPA: Calx-beta domain-containing protein [Nocardioidaceae bacterium]
MALVSLVSLVAAPAAHVGVAAATPPSTGSVIALGTTGHFGNAGTFPDAFSDPNPELLPNVGQVVAVAGDNSTGVALLPDGTVWSWGSNHYGQLGDGTTTDSATPVEAIGVSNAVAISSDGVHTLALTSGGSVWAWGANAAGQLGDGTTTDRSTPVPVSGLSNVVAISSDNNAYNTGGVGLALLADGTVWSWGSNDYGVLGTGSGAEYSAVPAQIPGLSNVVSVSTSGLHSLAATSDGSVWAWGAGFYDELGDGGGGPFHFALTPIQVPGVGSITSVSAGDVDSTALASDGTVWFWGAYFANPKNFSGFPPGQVRGLSDVASVTAGRDAVFAVTSDGSLWDWGTNTVGQLGDGNLTTQLAPSEVTTIAGVTSVSSTGALLVGSLVGCTGVCASIGDVMGWAGGAMAFPITLNKPAATDTTITVWINNDPVSSQVGPCCLEFGLQYSTFKMVTIKAGHIEGFVTFSTKDLSTYFPAVPPSQVPFAATLISSSATSIARAGGVGLENDSADLPGYLHIGAARIVEPDSGKVTVRIPVLLGAADPVNKVTVQYRTADGTATAGNDYVAKPKITNPPATLTIPRMVRRASVAVTVLGHMTPEATKTFSINFTNPMFATIPYGTVAPVTILDNGD